MRIGILTGGGDCQGLNAAIRGASLSLMEHHNADIVAIEDGFLGLIEKRTHSIERQRIDTILDKGGTVLGTSNRASPFNYNGEDVSHAVADYYTELKLDGIIAMGGDGTMTLCHKMSALGMNFVGVPKTIDNDIAESERSFGFDTAVNIAVEAIDRLRTTAQSHKRVMILETMGRNAGWIALHAGVAGGADVILLPEFPYHLDHVINKINQNIDHQAYTIVVVAEGAYPADGQQSIKQTVANSPEPLRLGGIGHALQEQLTPHISAEIRTTVLGHLQRGGTPSGYDRLIATNVGCYAAALVSKGDFGKLVTIQGNRLCTTPLELVAEKTRVVTQESMALIGALATGTCLGSPELTFDVNALEDGVLAMG